jgi:hypothetical protein
MNIRIVVPLILIAAVVPISVADIRLPAIIVSQWV